jgi:hypothetical protein
MAHQLQLSTLCLARAASAGESANMERTVITGAATSVNGFTHLQALLVARGYGTVENADRLAACKTTPLGAQLARSRAAALEMSLGRAELNRRPLSSMSSLYRALAPLPDGSGMRPDFVRRGALAQRQFEATGAAFNDAASVCCQLLCL